MGEDVSAHAGLGKAGEEELFYLHNGLTIDSIRELVVQLHRMDEESFRHHVDGDKNDFATWIHDVFGDDELAETIKRCTDKEEMAVLIEKRVVALEETELERFGVHLPDTDLQTLELYIEKQLRKGKTEEAIKDALLAKGWSHKIISLVLVGKSNPYRAYESIEDIENMEAFRQKLQMLKGLIIGAISKGKSVKEIKEFLARNGWHQDILDFIFYDVFEPHPNIKKLSSYITHQIKVRNKTVEEVKSTLTGLGWKAYIIDSIIYGINDPDNSLHKVLAYLEEFGDEENQEQLKTFLLQMGWKENDVNEALRQKRIDEVKQQLTHTFNLDDGKALKQASKVISETIVSLPKGSKELFHAIARDEGYQKIARSELHDNEGELHKDEEYYYYFSADDLKTVEGLEEKAVNNVYYATAEKPLMIETHNYYLVLPQVIRRRCVVCNKRYSLDKLKKVEMWDETRTHKVVKFVCEKDQKEIETFLDQTRIVQL